MPPVCKKTRRDYALEVGEARAELELEFVQGEEIRSKNRVECKKGGNFYPSNRKKTPTSSSIAPKPAPESRTARRYKPPENGVLSPQIEARPWCSAAAAAIRGSGDSELDRRGAADENRSGKKCDNLVAASQMTKKKGRHFGGDGGM